VPLAIRPGSTSVDTIDVSAEQVCALPSVTATRHFVIARVTVRSEFLSESGEKLEKLHNAIVTENPFSRSLVACEHRHHVVKSTVVSECVKW